MRSSISSLALVISLGACAGPGSEVGVTPQSEAGETPSESPAATAPQAPGELEPEVVGVHMISFFVVYEALRDGDWRQFDLFMGAPFVYEREQSIGEKAPERSEVSPADARTWLAEAAATWAPTCNENPDPPCLSMNLLSVGSDDYWDIQLRCESIGSDESSEVCCTHDAALLHNTPFLVGVCFDLEQRVTRIAVLDG